MCFKDLHALEPAGGKPLIRIWPGRRDMRQDRTGRDTMKFRDITGPAYRSLTARKDGPSLYDVCGPLLLKPSGGDPHLTKFYRTALGNPALRPLLRPAGLPELRDAPRLQSLSQALIRARDDETPDWAAIGAPVADLLDTIDRQHPKPAPPPAPPRAPAC